MYYLLPIIILGITTAIVATLYLREYNLRKKLQVQDTKVLEDFRVKGLDLLHQSMKKSQDILGNAELESVKVLADTRLSASKLEEGYNSKLTEMIKQSQDAISFAQSRIIDSMSTQLQKSAEFETTQQKNLEQRIN